MSVPTYSTFSPAAYKFSSSQNSIYGYIIPNAGSDIKSLYQDGILIRVNLALDANIKITSLNTLTLLFVLITPELVDTDTLNNTEIELGSGHDRFIGINYVIKAGALYREYTFRAGESVMVNFYNLFYNASYFFHYNGDVTNSVIQIMCQNDTVALVVYPLTFEYTTSSWISTTEAAFNLGGIDVNTGCSLINKSSKQTISANDILSNSSFNLGIANQTDYDAVLLVLYKDLTTLSDSVLNHTKTVALRLITKPTYIAVGQEVFGSLTSTEIINSNKFYLGGDPEDSLVAWNGYNPTYFSESEDPVVTLVYLSKFKAEYDTEGYIYVPDPSITLTPINTPIQNQAITAKKYLRIRTFSNITDLTIPEDIENEECVLITTVSFSLDMSYLVEYKTGSKRVAVKEWTFELSDDSFDVGFSVGSGRRVLFEPSPIQVKNGNVTQTSNPVENSYALLNHYKDNQGNWIDFGQNFQKVVDEETTLRNIYHTLNDYELDYLFNKRPNHSKLIKHINFKKYDEEIYKNAVTFSKRLRVKAFSISGAALALACWLGPGLVLALDVTVHKTVSNWGIKEVLETIFTNQYYNNWKYHHYTATFYVPYIFIAVAVYIAASLAIAGHKGSLDCPCGLMILPDNWSSICNDYIENLRNASLEDTPDRDKYIDILQKSLSDNDETLYDASFLPLFSGMGAHIVGPSGYLDALKYPWQLTSAYWGASSQNDKSENKISYVKGRITSSMNNPRDPEPTLTPHCTWHTDLVKHYFPLYLAYYVPWKEGYGIEWRISINTYSSATINDSAYVQKPHVKTTGYSTTDGEIYYDNLCTGSDYTYYQGRINVGYGYKKICNEMFKSSNILYCKIPTGVTTIGNSAFLNSQLQTIVIPATVTSIEADAFSGTSLTNIYYEANEASWNKVSKSSAAIPNCTINFNKYDSV